MLMTFIRRELRILAPWLAYGLETRSVNVNPRTSAVTNPLIYGIPIQVPISYELEQVTLMLINHFCMVPMTNEESVVNLLCDLPGFHSSLIPRSYLYRFASEVLQFAKFHGSMSDYDDSVCLVRRYILPLSAIAGNPPHEYFAVYFNASDEQIRLGQTTSQYVIIHACINWLLSRLFVHSVSGSDHPNPIIGTGESLETTSIRPISYRSRITCHPNCTRLAETSRTLLEAVQTLMPFHFHINNMQSAANDNDIYNYRLFYQRILSELIDQARFSEALSGQFCYFVNESRYQDTNSLDGIDTTSIDENWSTNLNFAIQTHPYALKRLDGLLYLVTVQPYNMGSSQICSIYDLMRLSLLPITPSSSSLMIDLTRSSSQMNQQQQTNHLDFTPQLTSGQNSSRTSRLPTTFNESVLHIDLLDSMDSFVPEAQNTITIYDTSPVINQVSNLPPVNDNLSDRVQSRFNLNSDNCVIVSSDSSISDMEDILTPDISNSEESNPNRPPVSNYAICNECSDHSAYTKPITITAPSKSEASSNQTSNVQYNVNGMPESIEIELNVDLITSGAQRHEEPMDVDNNSEENKLDDDSPNPCLVITDDNLKNRTNSPKRHSKVKRGSANVTQQSFMPSRSILPHHPRSGHTKPSKFRSNLSQIEIETSDSDCELISESIRLDNNEEEGEKYQSSSSSSDLEDESVILFVKSPTKRKNAHKTSHKHRTKRKKYKCRQDTRLSVYNSTNCYCHINYKPRYNEQSDDLNLKGFHSNSPIVISDDEEEQKDVVQHQDDKKDDHVRETIIVSSSSNTISESNNDLVQNTSCSPNITKISESGSSESLQKNRLFEPLNSEEFYYLLDQFKKMSEKILPKSKPIDWESAKSITLQPSCSYIVPGASTSSVKFHDLNYTAKPDLNSDESF